MKLFDLVCLLDPRLVAYLIQRRRFQRLKQIEEAGFTPQWFLACGAADKSFVLRPDPGKLNRIIPPPNRLWADPFLCKQSGRHFVFFEEWLFGRPYAHISVMELGATGKPLSDPLPVLQEPYHLSYPFLFEHEGTLLMMPEGGAAKTIDIYECVEFPSRWRKRVSLMRDVQAADPTLHFHSGKWWLFMTMRRGVHGLGRDLFLFSAEHPLSTDWRPHPRNPVVRDARSARPAGGLIQLDNTLYRPSQNCLVRYGHKLRINRILELSTNAYREELSFELEPTWLPGLRSNHHIHWCEGLVAMDAQHLLNNNEVSKAT